MRYEENKDLSFSCVMKCFMIWEQKSGEDETLLKQGDLRECFVKAECILGKKAVYISGNYENL